MKEVLASFKEKLTEIADAIRTLNNTDKAYTLGDFANAIKEGCQVYYLGRGTSFDVTCIQGYEGLTSDNFIVAAVGSSGSYSLSQYYATQTRGNSVFGVSKSYNASTGKLSCSASVTTKYDWDDTGTGTIQMESRSYAVSVDAYVVFGSIKTV